MIRTDISEIGRITKEEIKSRFFEISKIDKPLARLTKKREYTDKIRSEKGKISTDTVEIHKEIIL